MVHYDDGTSFTFVTLERPNIHFDSEGQMTHINLAADLTTTDSGCGHGRACAECKFYRHCGTTIIKLDTGGTGWPQYCDGCPLVLGITTPLKILGRIFCSTR